jgi:regulator of protease activity HflC (stomatin/prohibitin superfamily)
MIYLEISLVLLALYLLWSVRRVPTGAVGVVLLLGRRTGEVRGEGITWLPRGICELVTIFVRERQIDVPSGDYYSSDRVRISFKTTLRVVVADAAALFNQGPGTFDPFTREGRGGLDSGAEEASVALRRAVQNSIRDIVQGLTIHDALFGGRGQGMLRDRIQDGLAQTARRWGLRVEEVWLTEVLVADQELQRAVQAEVREQMEGKGRLAADEARVAKGALFSKVAAELALQMRQQLGREVSVEEATRFLLNFYRTDRELDVALEAAGTTGGLVNMLLLQQAGLSGASSPGGVLPVALPQSPPGLLPGKAPQRLPDGSWIVGREGDIVVAGDGISRRHALLSVNDGVITITDLGSTNGTYVAGQRLPPNQPTVLGLGDTLRLGKTAATTPQDLIASLWAGTRG